MWSALGCFGLTRNKNHDRRNKTGLDKCREAREVPGNSESALQGSPLTQTNHQAFISTTTAEPALLRDALVLSKTFSSVTLLTWHGRVLHQNAASRQMFGVLECALATQSSHLAAHDGTGAQPLLLGQQLRHAPPGDGAPLQGRQNSTDMRSEVMFSVTHDAEGNLLARIFAYEPDKLAEMLLQLCGGEVWRGVVRVPYTLHAGDTTTCGSCLPAGTSDGAAAAVGMEEEEEEASGVPGGRGAASGSREACQAPCQLVTAGPVEPPPPSARIRHELVLDVTCGPGGPLPYPGAEDPASTFLLDSSPDPFLPGSRPSTHRATTERRRGSRHPLHVSPPQGANGPMELSGDMLATRTSTLRSSLHEPSRLLGSGTFPAATPTAAGLMLVQPGAPGLLGPERVLGGPEGGAFEEGLLDSHVADAGRDVNRHAEMTLRPGARGRALRSASSCDLRPALPGAEHAVGYSAGGSGGVPVAAAAPEPTALRLPGGPSARTIAGYSAHHPMKHPQSHTFHPQPGSPLANRRGRLRARASVDGPAIRYLINNGTAPATAPAAGNAVPSGSAFASLAAPHASIGSLSTSVFALMLGANTTSPSPVSTTFSPISTVTAQQQQHQRALTGVVSGQANLRGYVAESTAAAALAAAGPAAWTNVASECAYDSAAANNTAGSLAAAVAATAAAGSAASGGAGPSGGQGVNSSDQNVSRSGSRHGRPKRSQSLYSVSEFSRQGEHVPFPGSLPAAAPGGFFAAVAGQGLLFDPDVQRPSPAYMPASFTPDAVASSSIGTGVSLGSGIGGSRGASGVGQRLGPSRALAFATSLRTAPDLKALIGGRPLTGTQATITGTGGSTLTGSSPSFTSTMLRSRHITASSGGYVNAPTTAAAAAAHPTAAVAAITLPDVPPPRVHQSIDVPSLAFAIKKQQQQQQQQQQPRPHDPTQQQPRLMVLAGLVGPPSDLLPHSRGLLSPSGRAALGPGLGRQPAGKQHGGATVTTMMIPEGKVEADSASACEEGPELALPARGRSLTARARHILSGVVSRGHHSAAFARPKTTGTIRSTACTDVSDTHQAVTQQQQQLIQQQERTLQQHYPQQQILLMQNLNQQQPPPQQQQPALHTSDNRSRTTNPYASAAGIPVPHSSTATAATAVAATASGAAGRGVAVVSGSSLLLSGHASTGLCGPDYSLSSGSAPCTDLLNMPRTCTGTSSLTSITPGNGTPSAAAAAAAVAAAGLPGLAPVNRIFLAPPRLVNAQDGYAVRLLAPDGAPETSEGALGADKGGGVAAAPGGYVAGCGNVSAGMVGQQASPQPQLQPAVPLVGGWSDERVGGAALALLQAGPEAGSPPPQSGLEAEGRCPEALPSLAGLLAVGGLAGGNGSSRSVSLEANAPLVSPPSPAAAVAAASVGPAAAEQRAPDGDGVSLPALPAPAAAAAAVAAAARGRGPAGQVSHSASVSQPPSAPERVWLAAAPEGGSAGGSTVSRPCPAALAPSSGGCAKEATARLTNVLVSGSSAGHTSAEAHALEVALMRWSRQPPGRPAPQTAPVVLAPTAPVVLAPATVPRPGPQLCAAGAWPGKAGEQPQPQPQPRQQLALLPWPRADATAAAGGTAEPNRAAQGGAPAGEVLVTLDEDAGPAAAVVSGRAVVAQNENGDEEQRQEGAPLAAALERHSPGQRRTREDPQPQGPDQVQVQDQHPDDQHPEGQQGPGQGEPEVYHEVWAMGAVDPVTGLDIIILKQHDVTAKVVAERHLALVMETEHRLLSQIFPRHVLQYITEEWTHRAHSASRPNTPTAAATSPGHPGVPTAAAGVADGSVQTGRHGAQHGSAGVPSASSTTAAAPTTPDWRPVVHDCNALATWHPEVTLLFADIKGFTPMCKEVEPRAVMAMLNDLFSRFDSKLDEFGVYKVETIGDCYFVAGGLLHEDEDGMAAVRHRENQDLDHAGSVFGFAKAMLEAATHVRLPTTGEPVSLRIGLHSGPVVSGVVGTRMPRFCLFGDTVNTASRMESTGVPGAIHASAATHELLRGEPGWEPTDGIEVKGKGSMMTFLWRP